MRKGICLAWSLFCLLWFFFSLAPLLSIPLPLSPPPLFSLSLYIPPSIYLSISLDPTPLWADGRLACLHRGAGRPSNAAPPLSNATRSTTVRSRNDFLSPPQHAVSYFFMVLHFVERRPLGNKIREEAEGSGRWGDLKN